MKNWLVAVVFAFLFISTSFAQASIEPKLFAPSGESFSLLSGDNFKTAPFSNGNTLYSSASDGRFVFIISQKQSVTASYAQMIYETELAEFALANDAREENFSAGQTLGTRYSFRDWDGLYETILIVSAEKAQHYIFHTLTEKEKDPDIEALLASVKIDGAVPDKFETVKRPRSSGGGEDAMPPSSKSGVDKNTSGAVNVPAPFGPLTDVKVLARDKGQYTDLARMYQVEGRVQLRVTFLADGHIGSVTPVNHVPFLTGSAIKAARQIRFEPAKRGDTPINVAKIVEYVFTLK